MQINKMKSNKREKLKQQYKIGVNENQKPFNFKM